MRNDFKIGDRVRVLGHPNKSGRVIGMVGDGRVKVSFETEEWLDSVRLTLAEGQGKGVNKRNQPDGAAAAGWSYGRAGRVRTLANAQREGSDE